MMQQAVLTPTRELLEWMDCELGVLIHYDMPTYHRDYIWNKQPAPPADSFCPDALDTDQWLAAAVSMGAKYAVLVAKHCSGFCLWPTAQHGYSVASSPWKGGKGDIVGDFIASCKKYGVKPGLYYSANANGYLGIHVDKLLQLPREEQQRYYNTVLAQLTEIWTRYGELFEIWFDGGVIPVEEGGPDIAGLLLQLQPNAVAFQGPAGIKSRVRWVGNESGIAAENCSAIVNSGAMTFDGAQSCYAGDTNGDLFCPGESDFPNRFELFAYQGGWFWAENEEQFVIPPDMLFERYLTSVGRNTNMLVGMGIDKHGRFPEVDCAAFRDFGSLLREKLGQAIATVEPQPGETQWELIVPEGKRAQYLVLQEDIAQGERVTEFAVFADDKEIYRGQIIGHKRILPLEAHAGSKLRVHVTACKADCRMGAITLY